MYFMITWRCLSSVSTGSYKSRRRFCIFEAMLRKQDISIAKFISSLTLIFKHSKMWVSDFYWMLPNVSVTQKSKPLDPALPPVSILHVIKVLTRHENSHQIVINVQFTKVLSIFILHHLVSHWKLEAVVFEVFGSRFWFRIGFRMRFGMGVFICLPIIHLQFVLKILWKSKSLEQGHPVVEGVCDSMFWDRVSLRCNMTPSV